MVEMPRGQDPLQSLSSLMTIASNLEDRKAQREENLYRRQERARVDEDRATMQSAQSSQLPPEEVQAQLRLLGKGHLAPVFEEGMARLRSEERRVGKECRSRWW